MNEQIQIGKASYGKQSFGGHGWFSVEANQDNIYRVLPPLKSLAREGKYAKYYRTHRGFRGSDNKQKPFRCIEVFDYKTKLIKEHCPVCDMVSHLEEEVKKFEARGATKEQIQKFRMENIFPFQAEGKYYLNVVNQENKIGVLPINSKLFNALDALATHHEKNGRDITGLEGVFLNFKKMSKYKGDKDAVFAVELHLQASQDGSFRYVSHTITPEFSARLVKEAVDLGDMFRVLNAEQIAQIVNLTGEHRAKYMDSLFAAPEKEAPAQQGLSTMIPNSNIAAVSRVENNPNGGFTVQQPTVPTGFNQPTAPPANFGQFQAPGIMPTAPAPTLTANPFVAQPAHAQSQYMPQISESMPDDEFMAIMRQPVGKG